MSPRLAFEVGEALAEFAQHRAVLGTDVRIPAPYPRLEAGRDEKRRRVEGEKRLQPTRS